MEDSTNSEVHLEDEYYYVNESVVVGLCFNKSYLNCTIWL